MPDDVYVLPIGTEFDLHTFSPQEVRSVVAEYVRAAAENGLTEVRVIHGRGTGVQRVIVQSVLEQHPNVTTFWDAPESHLGATIARIRPVPD